MSVTAMPRAAEGAAPADAAGAEAPAKKGKKKLVVILLVLLLAGGGAYWFLLKPSGGPPPPPKPGTVVPLDAIQINLAGDHYLRIGVALQLVAGVKEEDGSKALDATIDEFSGLPIATVTDPAKRRDLKKDLEKKLAKLYDEEVMGVYFTQFVTQ